MKTAKKVWNRWLSIAKPIGNFQSQVIFSIFYILVLGIFGIIFSFLKDPLLIKRRSISKRKTNFTPWDHLTDDINQARKQF